jgi:uncharacterized protein YjbI with pentapeptide repeats
MKKLTNKDLANLLKNNVKLFNDYREKYPNQKIDFTKLDNFINFKNSNLDDANLTNMNLEGLNFADSNMIKVKLKESNISNCNFTRCYLNKSDLRGVKAKNTCFKYAESEHCDYRGADVELSKFDNSILHNSDFRGSNLARDQIISAVCHIKSSDWWPDETYIRTIQTSSGMKQSHQESGKQDGYEDIVFFLIILGIIAVVFGIASSFKG